MHLFYEKYLEFFYINVINALLKFGIKSNLNVSKPLVYELFMYIIRAIFLYTLAKENFDLIL